MIFLYGKYRKAYFWPLSRQGYFKEVTKRSSYIIKFKLNSGKNCELFIKRHQEQETSGREMFAIYIYT